MNKIYLPLIVATLATGCSMDPFADHSKISFTVKRSPDAAKFERSRFTAKGTFDSVLNNQPACDPTTGVGCYSNSACDPTTGVGCNPDFENDFGPDLILPDRADGFDCLAINVFGEGIPDKIEYVDFIENNEFGYCQSDPIGLTSVVLSRDQYLDGGASIELVIPSGPARNIQVVGIILKEGVQCPTDMTYGQGLALELDNIRTQIAINDGQGEHVEQIFVEEVLEVGFTTVDIFNDAEVAITSNYNPAFPRRTVNCTDFNGGHDDFGNTGVNTTDRAYLGFDNGAFKDIGFRRHTSGTSTYHLEVENFGTFAAENLSAAMNAGPFQFTGGGYPGLAGTCGTTLHSGDHCYIEVQFDSAMTPNYYSIYLDLHYSSNGESYSDRLFLEGTIVRWTHLWGSATSGLVFPADVGGLGTFNAGNDPGAPAGAAMFVDGNGEPWVFGGEVNTGLYNGIWKYDDVLNQWALMNGVVTSNTLSNFDGTANGTMDIGYGGFAPARVPSGRQKMAYATNSQGKFFIFGGSGRGEQAGPVGELSDTWMFDRTVGSYGEWAPLNGSVVPGSVGSYGSQGVEIMANEPPSRHSPGFTMDASDYMWMFGGEQGGPNFKTDLWRLDTWTGKWTWISGLTTNDLQGDFGGQNVPSTANRPGSRRGSAMWVDFWGYVWIFGGHGLDDVGNPGLLNDLWKYDPFTQEWTWVTGSNLNGALGTYGAKGQANSSNTPGAREGANAWTDATGNLYLMGGFGSDSAGPGKSLNDIWMFDGKEWTWISGSLLGDTLATHGTLGVPASANEIGGLKYGASAYHQTGGTLFLFGGYGYGNGAIGNLNALWELR